VASRKAEFDRIGIRYKYSLVQDYGEFMVALGKTLSEGVREFKAVPMLHFSMHGSSEGIQLTDRRILDWRDLSWKLRLLNRAFARKLVVCMSSCYGLSGYKMLLEGMAVGELASVPPYGLLVGNVRPISWNVAEVGFVNLYRLLSEGSSFDDAILAMKTYTGDRFFFGTLPEPSGDAEGGLTIGVSDQDLEDFQTRYPEDPASGA
jgi:hypothetical protein